MLQLEQQQEQKDKKKKKGKEQKNILDEMEQETNKEENIQQLKGENLLIKIHQEG